MIKTSALCLMTSVCTITAALLSVSTASAGTLNTCKRGANERLVYVVYAQEGNKLPCKVKYTRAQGAPVQVLFNASTDPKFCEVRASELVERLKTSGYDCSGDS